MSTLLHSPHSHPHPHPHPNTPAHTPSTRIEVLDILRGFALFGIILVHFSEQYYAGQTPGSLAHGLGVHFLADEILQGIIFFFILGKFYMIFSFLFGFSFALQLRGKPLSGLFTFLWRLVLLFGIGFIHHLHYRGDILTIYAVLGAGLLLFYRLPRKWILGLALLLVLNVPSAVIRTVEALQQGQQPAQATQSPDVTDQKTDSLKLETYYQTVKSGTYGQVLQANLQEFEGKAEFQVSSGRVYITFGLFLLGLLAGEGRFFEPLPARDKLRQWRNRLWWTLGGVLILGLSIGLLQPLLPQALLWPIGGLLYDFMNATMAGLYVIILLLLFQLPLWQARLQHLAPVGRMGLTTYLTQTLIGTALFFGWGGGLLHDLPIFASVLLGVAVFYGQMKFSQWWLNRYAYGLFEWLWRCGTYGRWVHLRRVSAQP